MKIKGNLILEIFKIYLIQIGIFIFSNNTSKCMISNFINFMYSKQVSRPWSNDHNVYNEKFHLIILHNFNLK